MGMTTPSKVIYEKEDFIKLQKEYSEYQKTINALENTNENHEKLLNLLKTVISFDNVSPSSTELFVEVNEITRKVTILGR